MSKQSTSHHLGKRNISSEKDQYSDEDGNHKKPKTSDDKACEENGKIF